MISIFAKPAFLNTASNVPFVSKEVSYKGNGHLQRVSSMIRADQLAAFLGCKLNPQSNYKNDVCIYVKPHVPKGTTDFNFEGKRNYVDIVDGWGLLPVLEAHPEVGVIACSQQDYNILSATLKNKVVFIPQHHCNFERVKRTRKEVITVGIIGTEDAFKFLPEGLEAGLEEKGIKLLKFSKFFSREDIVNFYQSIDIQLVWRPYRMRLSNPLKIVNASSFGIPTVAYNESVFGEVTGCYLAIKDEKVLIDKIVMLKEEPSIYQAYVDKCLDTAENYHIENVAKEYKKL